MIHIIMLSVKPTNGIVGHDRTEAMGKAHREHHRYNAEMARKRNTLAKTDNRLTLNDIARVDKFEPMWICCSRCSELAHMTPRWPERRGECKCISCGAIYNLSLGQEYATRYLELPLWLKGNFRSHTFLSAAHPSRANCGTLQLLYRTQKRRSLMRSGCAGKCT